MLVTDAVVHIYLLLHDKNGLMTLFKESTILWQHIALCTCIKLSGSFENMCCRHIGKQLSKMAAPMTLLACVQQT